MKKLCVSDIFVIKTTEKKHLLFGCWVIKWQVPQIKVFAVVNCNHNYLHSTKIEQEIETTK